MLQCVRRGREVTVLHSGKSAGHAAVAIACSVRLTPNVGMSQPLAAGMVAGSYCCVLA
jgi:hypothetical protein